MNRIGNLLRGLNAAGVPLRVLFDTTQFTPTQDGAKLRKALRQLRMKEGAFPVPRAPYAYTHGVAPRDIREGFDSQLDDVGSEKPTAASAGVLYSVINFRYDAMLPTVITSNYSLGRLADHLAPADSHDEVTQAQRICDRILEMASAVEIKDQSHRGEITNESNVGRVQFMKLIDDLSASRAQPQFEQAGNEMEPVGRRAIEGQIAAMMPDFSDETAGKPWRKPERRSLDDDSRSGL